MSLLKLRKVLISDKIASDCLEAFNGRGVDVTYKPGLSKKELIEIIPEYNGLIVRSATKVTADVIKAAVNLEVCLHKRKKISDIQ
jgi:D-3-phosphoglycerate dehydrogenase